VEILDALRASQDLVGRMGHHLPNGVGQLPRADPAAVQPVPHDVGEDDLRTTALRERYDVVTRLFEATTTGATKKAAMK
jgi:hypothetical protein